MSSLRTIRNSTGKQIVLRSELGRGGEGTVYSVEGDNKLAAKIYHQDKANERREKILSIVNANWHAQASNVAFPIDALFNASNQFIGFTMPRVGGHKPIERLYSPTSRKTDFPKSTFPFLVRVALNIARALANVNATGCVVGDINHSGVLVSDDATVTLIDCDSFQVSSNGKLFHCKVGVSEFTPPELQGKRLDQIVRTTNHDSFGLAVLLFSLLFMGRHPFAGKYLGKGDMPMETAITQFRFAYSARKGETKMEPPPNVPLLTDIPQNLANAFEIAFGPPGVSVGRPTPANWIELLESAEKKMVRCGNNAAHQYFQAAKSCPWCAMERAYPGFIAFSPTFPSNLGTPVDLGQLIAAINAVPDPGIVNPLRTLMPIAASSPSPLPSVSKDNWEARYFGGLIAALCSLEFFYLSYPGPLVGVLALGGGVWMSFKQWDAVEPFRKKTAQISKQCDELEERWRPISNNRSFQEIRAKANECIKQFQCIGPEEAKGITDLKLKQREQQQTRFLERFHIQHASIKGIGNTRKVTLISYGVETAADVSAQRIKRISGFGPSMAGAIVAWRISIERKFVFDPSQPINPADITSIKTKYAKKKADLQAELRQWLTQLRTTSANIVQSREQLRTAALPVWQSLRQAELDERTVQNQLPSSKHKWGFGFVVFLGFVIIASLNNPTRVAQTPQPPANNPQSSLPPIARNTDPSIRPPVSKPDPKSSDNRVASGNEVKPAFDPKLIPPPTEHVPFGWPEATPSGNEIEVNKNAKPPSTLALTPPPTEQTPPKWLEPHVLTPPSPSTPSNAPLEIAPVLDQPSSDARETRSLSNREDVRWIQSRLAELGFLKRSASGNWDSFSRAALRDFKITNKMASNDLWDIETEKAVASVSALKASDSFLGAWSETTPCDGSVPAPMVITPKRAASSSGGFCDFLNISPENGGWRIKSKCSSEGQTWTYDIRFSVTPGQLVWDGRSGKTTYFRCR
jgi:DNA-binding helix-hairpin-helix protein with protein kinase domain